MIDATGVTGAAIVGFSMGGGELARYMSRHEGRSVTHAALVSAVVPYMLKTDDNPHGTPQSVFDEMAKGMRDDRAKFFAGFFPDFFGVGVIAHPVSDELLRRAWSLSMQVGLKPTLACAKSFATTDFRPDLAAFDVPTLIVHGTSDKTVPIDASGRGGKGHPRGEADRVRRRAARPVATHKERLAHDLIAFLRR